MKGFFTCFRDQKKIKTRDARRQSAIDAPQSEISQLEEQNRQATQKANDTIKKTIKIAQDTDSTLNIQHQKIQDSHKKLGKIEVDNKNIKRDLRGINSCCGALFNKVSPCCITGYPSDSEDEEMDVVEIKNDPSNNGINSTDQNLTEIHDNVNTLGQFADKWNKQLKEQNHTLDKDIQTTNDTIIQVTENNQTIDATLAKSRNRRFCFF